MYTVLRSIHCIHFGIHLSTEYLSFYPVVPNYIYDEAESMYCKIFWYFKTCMIHTIDVGTCLFLQPVAWLWGLKSIDVCFSGETGFARRCTQ